MLISIEIICSVEAILNCWVKYYSDRRKWEGNKSKWGAVAIYTDYGSVSDDWQLWSKERCMGHLKGHNPRLVEPSWIPSMQPLINQTEKLLRGWKNLKKSPKVSKLVSLGTTTCAVRVQSDKSGWRIFFSRVNFLCWLLFSVRSSSSALLQWHIKDHDHSAKVQMASYTWTRIHTWPSKVCPCIVWEPIRETSPHAPRWGILSHRCLSSLSHCGLILA